MIEKEHIIPRIWHLRHKKKTMILLVGMVGNKTREKFVTASKGHFATLGQNHKWTYEDWSRLAEKDGLLCRYSSDCDWLDERLGCVDRENIEFLFDKITLFS